MPTVRSPQDEWAEAGERARTDLGGWFDLPLRVHPSEDLEVVIWATAPSYAASARSLLSPADWTSDCVIALRSANDVEVEVTDVDGTPAVGAVVRQVGLELASRNSRAFESEMGVQSAFHREYGTDARGRLSLPRFDGPQRIDASMGGLCALPFVGDPRTRVHLTLRSGFDVRGRVGASSVPLPNSARVIAESSRCSLRTELGCVLVATDGTWAMSGLPAGDVDEVVLRLEGDDLAPCERSIGRPEPGATYSIDFDIERGLEALVLARRTTGEVCAGTTVYARWYRDGRFIELERRSGADGIARLPIALGLATYFGARADGLWSPPSGPHTFLEPATEPVLLELAPAGRIRGRCLHQGIPLSDFEVVYWQHLPANRQILHVNDAEDGSFVIEDAPLGEVFVLAQSSAWPARDAISIELAAGVEASVELNVGDACSGRGQVVDAASGQPISSAGVQAVTTLPDTSTVLRGAFLPVDSTGEFELGGLPIGQSFVWVVAPGYGPRVVGTHTAAHQRADFGVIPLARTQALTLQLESTTGVDFSRAFAQSFDSPLLPVRFFDADGSLVYEDVPPRALRLQVTVGDELMELLDLTLVAGQVWSYTIRTEGGRSCTVNTISSVDAVKPEYVQATFRRDGSTTSRYVHCDANGRARFEGVEGEEIALAAYAADWSMLAAKTWAIASAGDFEVELRCDRTGLRVRVIDGAGAPVAGAGVSAGSASTFDWAYSYVADGSGECTVGPFDVPRIWVRASSNSIGVSAPVLVQLDSKPTDPVTISLADVEPLRVRVEDDRFPCAGVEVHFSCEDRFSIGSVQTDSSGRAVSQAVGAGHTFVDIDDIGYWPIHHALPYPRADGETVVPLRRLGGVRFEARGLGAAVVPGARLELSSIEFGASVEQWIAEGKLAARAGGLVTDSSGVLVLDGLPNGEYTWRATAPDGSQASGTTLVPPRARGEQMVVFGP